MFWTLQCLHTESLGVELIGVSLNVAVCVGLLAAWRWKAREEESR